MPTITTANGDKIVSPRYLISVPQHHIDSAIKGTSSHCMVADTIKELLPWARFVSVDIATIRFTDPKTGLRYTYLTPRVAQVAIVNFDDGKKPEPFSFWLRTAMITESAVGSKWSLHNAKKKKTARANVRRSKKRSLSKPEITTQASSNTGRVPHIVGGRTPPRAGTRREFGIRAFTSGDRA